MLGWIKMPLGTERGFGLGHIMLDGDPDPPKRDTAPNFRPMFVMAKRLDGSIKTPLSTKVGLGGSAQATMCWMGTQLPPKKAAQQSPLFGPCLL